LSFIPGFLPTLDKIRAGIPSARGIRSVTLVVRKTLMSGSMIDNPSVSSTDTVIKSISGDRYKVREMSTKDVVASGGKYQSGSLRVGPMTPPFPGGGFTKDDLIPPSAKGQDVLYGITDQTGVTQWCSMADADTANDLHWYLVLNPTGSEPSSP
jgi:hypothetical protein